MPAPALAQIAEADGFRASLKQSGREALWALKGLRDEPLALFVATAARAEQETAIAEQVKPDLALRPMTGGREVVED